MSFVLLYLFLVLEGEADVVEAVEQPMAGEGVYLETLPHASATDGAFLEVHG